jgi:hypothetical protein
MFIVNEEKSLLGVGAIGSADEQSTIDRQKIAT